MSQEIFQRLPIVYLHTQFDGMPETAAKLADELEKDGCTDVETFDLENGLLSLDFVSSDIPYGAEPGDYIVKRIEPNVGSWEVWSEDDFEVEFLGNETRD